MHSGEPTARADDLPASSAAPSLRVVSSSPSALDQALGRARSRDLAHSRMWQVLLHYRPTLGGGWKSEADGLGFFFAGKLGQRDPQAELDATLKALFETPPSRSQVEQPQCLFPARTTWLRGELDLDERALPTCPCPAYATWRAGISANAATLVYTTAYLNSPASTYGHTFLRLSRSTGEGNQLLDYIVNFGADVTTTNGLVYAFEGITGGFDGHFYVMPYYMKVQEYSNLESRDLWEYGLSLTALEIDRLVAHAWETRSTFFGYYFFTRNCSYHLLALLEVARPELHLVDGFRARVIPADTVRVVLAQPGLVTGVVARPSILSFMNQRKALLADDEVGSAETWAKLPTDAPPPPPGARPPAREALMLDAAYDYMRFREGLKTKPTDDFKRRERKLFLARGRTGEPPVSITVSPGTDAPERGHATLRTSVGGGWSNASGAFERLSIRPSLHDYLDPPEGYPPDATLVMAAGSIRFDDQSRRLRLDRVDALEIISAFPWTRWVNGMSWRVWLGADNARELGCDGPAANPHGWRCLYGGLTSGGGISARFLPGGRALGVLFADADAGAGPAFPGNHVRLGFGPEAFIAARVTSFLETQLGGRYIYYPVGDKGGHARATAAEAFRLSRIFALRLGVATADSYAEAWAELFAYL